MWRVASQVERSPATGRATTPTRSPRCVTEPVQRRTDRRRWSSVAAELLQGHDDTGLSLDHWLAPRMLVEMLIGRSIIENEV